MTSVVVRLLQAGESDVLRRVAPNVFDHEVNPAWAMEFLADSRHHLAVAIESETVIGMASAVHYVHPDKAPQLWINEVAVAPAHRRRGTGRALLACLEALATRLNCTEMWVLTDEANAAAKHLYQAAGADTPPVECLMYTIPLSKARS